MPELQKLIGNQAAKAVGDPKKRISKRKGGANDDNVDDVNEPANEDEEIVGSDKPKKGTKPRGRGKKPPIKRKFEDIEDDEDNAGGDPADDSDDEEDNKKKMEKATTSKRSKAVKSSLKKVQTNQKNKTAKKKAK